MSRSDSLHFQVLTGVTGQLEHLSGQVLQDGGRVDGCRGTHTTVRSGSRFQMTMNSANLQAERVKLVDCLFLFFEMNEIFKSKRFEHSVFTLTGNCRPARAEREMAFAFDLPESLPALPPAYWRFERGRERESVSQIRESTF